MLWPSEVLPTPGGPTKHRIGLRPSRIQLSHREKLEDAPLDLLEPEMVFVEDGARPLDVELFRVGFRPRHGDQPVEIGARHGILGGAFRHALEPRKLALRLLLRLRRHRGVLDGFLQVLEFRAGALGLAELLLDLPQTLAQHRLLLPLIERLARALIDLRAKP